MKATITPAILVASVLLVLAARCRSLRSSYHLAARHRHPEPAGARHRLGALLRHRRATSRSRPSPSSASAPIRSPCSAKCCPGRLSLSPPRASALRSLLLVGLSTLRLSGVYFVIFTFGLAELIRQLVTWYEVNVTRLRGPLRLHRHHAGIDLLAAVRAGRARLRWSAGSSSARAWVLRCGSSATTRPSPRHCGIDTTARQAPALRGQRRLHDAHGRHHGAALDLSRPDDRLQPGAVVPGPDHGAARRRPSPVGTASRGRSR